MEEDCHGLTGQFAVVSAVIVTVRKHQENIPKLVLYYGPVKFELANQTSLEFLRQTIQMLRSSDYFQGKGEDPHEGPAYSSDHQDY